MSATARTSIPIVGNNFSIYCSVDSSVEVISYISGKTKRLNVEYTQKNNDFKIATVATHFDGYYFVRSGKNVQSLKRGNVPYKIFIFDSLQRDDLKLHPESYDKDGKKIGDNKWEYIGFGIYAIDPLVLIPSIVKVLGRLFYCFPKDNIVRNDNKNKIMTIKLGDQSNNTMVSIGGTSSRLTVDNENFNIKANQTIIRV